MRYDNKVYQSFAEFEREELLRMDSATIDDMIDACFGDDLDFSIKEACWFDSKE